MFKDDYIEEKAMLKGYCSIHGYDWCKCLKALEEDKMYWSKLFKKDKKKEKKK